MTLNAKRTNVLVHIDGRHQDHVPGTAINAGFMIQYLLKGSASDIFEGWIPWMGAVVFRQ